MTGFTESFEPYCHGTSQKGLDTLRAVQVSGVSRSGKGEKAGGKLWTVAKMLNVRPTGEAFEPDDPSYNPDDSAMASIHCRIDRGTRP